MRRYVSGQNSSGSGGRPLEGRQKGPSVHGVGSCEMAHDRLRQAFDRVGPGANGGPDAVGPKRIGCDGPDGGGASALKDFLFLTNGEMLEKSINGRGGGEGDDVYFSGEEFGPDVARKGSRLKGPVHGGDRHPSASRFESFGKDVARLV